MNRPTYWERLVEGDVQDLFEAIEHGDEEHRAWLLAALKAWNARESVPAYCASLGSLRITPADIRAALEECSSCCLDEPEEVEKVIAALLRRAR